jgi:prepilin-type N-terminal cleavage/methylation domain-containing protein
LGTYIYLAEHPKKLLKGLKSLMPLAQKLKRFSRGFTLIEVLVSMALLATIGSAITSGIYTVYRADQSGNVHVSAVGILQTQMEYVDGLVYIPATGTAADYGLFTGSIPAGYSLRSVRADATYSITNIIGVPWNVQTGTSAGAENGLQRIRLAVVRNGQVVTTLDAYKVQPQVLH